MIPFIPQPHEEERIRQAQQEVQYRCVYEETYPGSGIENVKFQHRWDWRINPDFFSITGIANKPNLFWQCIRVLWVIGAFSGPLWVYSAAYKNKMEVQATYKANYAETQRWLDAREAIRRGR